MFLSMPNATDTSNRPRCLPRPLSLLMGTRGSEKAVAQTISSIVELEEYEQTGCRKLLCVGRRPQNTILTFTNTLSINLRLCCVAAPTSTNVTLTINYGYIVGRLARLLKPGYLLWMSGKFPTGLEIRKLDGLSYTPF